MNFRRKIHWGLGIVVIMAAGAFFISGQSERKSLAETRRALRASGFKVDLSEFDLTTTEEMRRRVAVLTNALAFRADQSKISRRFEMQRAVLELTKLVGSNSALVVWREDRLPGQRGEDLWPVQRAISKDEDTELAAAILATVSGPIQFDFKAQAADSMTLPHLSAMRELSQRLELRVLTALHENDRDRAWTNLLALTRVVTAYEPEPVEVSKMVRWVSVADAFEGTWQALQAGGWQEERLAALQKEWESADFLGGLLGVEAFDGASMATVCQVERDQPGPPMGSWTELIRYPRHLLSAIHERFQHAAYRRHGSYEDEKEILLYYRDRESEMRRALQGQSWKEMRSLPGVTRVTPFRSKYPSLLQSLWNSRKLHRGGNSFLGQAAASETRRRLLVCAIALERYRGRHGFYPKVLQELAPEFLRTVPVDFMDGQLLRYRLGGDGHFILYSVGLNCIDQGGILPRWDPTRGVVRSLPDLMWPRPASADEVETARKEKIEEERRSVDRYQEMEAVARWRRSVERQASVEKLLAAPREGGTTEPMYRGRPLSEVLRQETTQGTNRLKLDDLLTLRPVTTGQEPELLTFEVPVAYDILTNLGSLYLILDPVERDHSEGGCLAGKFDCVRATNGNTLLLWNTIFESPGKHALQAGLEISERGQRPNVIFGPFTSVVLSNLVQFSLSSQFFDPRFGATFRLKLPEPEGVYTLEILSVTGGLIRTIRGSTSNGVITAFWDLLDDQGRRFHDDAFDSRFHVTLPGSGRSETFKGP